MEPEAARVLKHGGWFGLSVYARGGGYDARVRNLWRKLFNWLWPVFGPRPPLWYSYATIYGLWPLHKIPVVGQITRMIFPCAFYLPDHRWKLLDTFDSVTPSYQSTHITHEVFKWFKSAGFSQIEPTPWGSTSFRGTGSG